MSAAIELSADGSRLRVHLPLAMRKRGGRKIIVVPYGATINSLPRRPVSALVKGIARAYRWQRMLEGGTYGSAEDIAKEEKISASYVNRLLQLTLLSPAIIEIILIGRQPATMTMAELLHPLPTDWTT